MKEAHGQLFLDAAVAGALLCTSNARLVRRLPEHVHIPTYTHAPRWLVGDCVPLSESESKQLEANPYAALLAMTANEVSGESAAAHGLHETAGCEYVARSNV